MAIGDSISIYGFSYGWYTNEMVKHDFDIGTRAYVLRTTYYIASPVWRVYYKCNHSGTGYSYGKFAAYKWNGTAFESSPATDKSGNSMYWNGNVGYGAGPFERVYAHFHNEGYDNEEDCHLWKIVANWDNDDGVFHGSVQGRLTVRLGTVEVSTQSYQYKKGSLIYCCPNVCYRNGETLPTNVTVDDTTFIDYCKPTVWKGGPASWANRYMAYSIKET